MNSVLGKAQIAYSQYSDDKYNSLTLVKEIYSNILKNKNVIIKANERDVYENNGFKVDFDVIKYIIKEIQKNEILYKNKLLNKAKNKLTEYDSLGVIEVFFDGNTYVLIEMALKNIISHNSMIFISQLDYMKCTNTAICNIIMKTLEIQKINKDIVQLVYDFNLIKYCTNNLVVKKAFVIGNTDLHNTLKRISELNTYYIGYNDCDIYIENVEKIDSLIKFINSNNNVLFKIYSNKSIENKLEDIIFVDDIDEVIEKIKCDSCNYCCMIFSDNKQNNIKFAELNKSKYIVINKTMDFNQILDIDINEFYCKKIIRI